MSDDQAPRSLTDAALTVPQYLLPQHAVSRMVHRATRWRTRWWKDALISWFMRHHGIVLDDYLVTEPTAFTDFNAFFTRALRDGARSLPAIDDAVASPVDGTVSQAGAIDDATIFQAKGHAYDLVDLLGGSRAEAAPFRDGTFTNLYLSPRDYHRIHMPLDGRLRRMVYVPGRLFAVNPPAVRTVPGLFARNERVVLTFDGATGPFALVLVGAFCVGSIETVWHGEITPPHGRETRLTAYAEHNAPALARGDELGRFNMGSTVIALFPPGSVELNATLRHASAVRMGQAIGRIRPAN